MAVFKETADEANCIPTQLNSGLTPAAKRIRRRRARRNPGEKDFEASSGRENNSLTATCLCPVVVFAGFSDSWCR